MDPAGVDLDGVEPGPAGERLQRARHLDVALRDERLVRLVGVEVGVPVPPAAVRTGVAGERLVALRDAGVEPELQAEAHAVECGPVGEEWQVERGAVPGHEDAAGEAADVTVDVGQQLRLRRRPEDDRLLAHPGDGHGEHARLPRVDPASRRVRLDVEPVERRLAGERSRDPCHRHRCERYPRPVTVHGTLRCGSMDPMPGGATRRRARVAARPRAPAVGPGRRHHRGRRRGPA